MFGTKEKTEAESPATYPGPVRVLKIDFNPSKAQEQLEPWVSAGWQLESTESVHINGQTIFLLAFLTKKPKDYWRDQIG